MPNKPLNISRRNFVKTAGALGSGILIAPHLLSCSANNRLNIAIIGAGGRGIQNWKPFVEENIVAICDVDDRMIGPAVEAFPEARRFKDYRVMFDKMQRQIDAVIVSTPDHTHFAATIAAIDLGMHVYVEKPLAHNVWQVRELKERAAKKKIISQMGNQGHATDGIRRVKEWYEAGVLGEVREVHAWFNGPSWGGNWFRKPANFPPPEIAIPSELDWDLWLGPAKMRQYTNFYLPRVWRGWYDFSSGMLGDWGCHTLDAPFWSLDLGAPNLIVSEYKSETPDGFLEDASIVRYEFPARGNKPPVTLKWYQGGHKPEPNPEWGIESLPDSGMIMVGDKVSLKTGARPEYERLLLPEEEWLHFQENQPTPTISRIGSGPQLEWINAIKGDGPAPGSNFDYASDLTEMVLLGALAQKTNSRIEYDAKNMKVSNHPEFDRFIKEPTRAGW
ncbi:MAG: Gfo/Idh/MocA family oxidoreductase [Bacteroidetes bacterium]|jgi:predicted dehydrogenase|nr:Gfo/Idh/MocA family oxidoreductase [Bacteroidota bacterium]MBT3749950.1 Gfo/Idh/MocA family oxidoreductase [Bacteroidota bacterium]MBT4399417.1 Gfo/Idh/MocA family oxidoreductase [Bacteroidota bacterium]MBT4411078.1 Gfo/Idh/MocA family oxidoreductase [Bacteroidota bacterium]MBT5427222.1 Gfo/Idh/MocA family oxidoreductase [Bacteroidota bacterium]